MLGNRIPAGSTASSFVNALKRAHRSLNTRQRRIVLVASIILGSLVFQSLLRDATRVSSDQEAETIGAADAVESNETWAGSYLHNLADPSINNAVDELSKSSKFTTCQGSLLKLGKAVNFSTLEEVTEVLRNIQSSESNGQQRFIQATAFSVPCHA